MAIAAVTIAELLVGVLLADHVHCAARQQFVDEVHAIIPVIDYDAAVAVSHADCSSQCAAKADHAEPTI